MESIFDRCVLVVTYLTLSMSVLSCTEKDRKADRVLSEQLSEINLTKTQTFGDTQDVLFDRMGLVDVDDKNRVYISERAMGNRTIHVFSQDGSYVTNVSRQGNGPGEFRTLGYLNTPNDTLFLFDSFHHRLSTFVIGSDSSTYHFTESSNINVKSSPKIEEVGDKKVEKAFVFDNGEMLVGMADPPVPNDQERAIFYYQLDAEGKLIQQERLFEQNAITIFKTEANSFSVTMQLPFARRPLIAVSQDGIIFKAWSEDFKIDVLNTSGQKLRTISVPFKNALINKSEVLEWYESNKNFYQAVQNASFPERWPALNALLVDDQNRLWVSTIVENLDVYEWWVLTQTGDVITRFTWPRDKPIQAVKNGYLYTKEEDDNGIEEVVKYKINIDR